MFRKKKNEKPQKKEPLQSRPLLPKDSLVELRAKLVNRGQNGAQPKAPSIAPAGSQVSYDSASFPMGQKALNALMEAKKKNELEKEKKVNRSKTLVPRRSEFTAGDKDFEKFPGSQSDVIPLTILTRSDAEKELNIPPTAPEKENSSTHKQLNTSQSRNLLHFVDLAYLPRLPKKKFSKPDFQWKPMLSDKNITLSEDEDNDPLDPSSPSTSGGDGWASDGDPIFVPEEYELLSKSNGNCLLGDLGRGESNKNKRKERELEKQKATVQQTEMGEEKDKEKHQRGEFEKKQQKKCLQLSGHGAKDIKEKMQHDIELWKKQQQNRRTALTMLGKFSRDLRRPRSNSLPEGKSQLDKKSKHRSLPNSKALSLLSASLISPGTQHLLWSVSRKQQKAAPVDPAIAEMKVKKTI